MTNTMEIYPFTFSTDPHVALSSLDAFNEGAPLATFARMRREDPVAWCPEEDGKGFWSITRHDDLMALNKQSELLSSARGIRMEDQSDDEFEARKTFQETDAPEHSGFRMLLNAAFSRQQMAKYEDRIRAITANLIDKAIELGEFDATKIISRELPMRMLGQILGLPDKDLDWLVEKGDALISNSDPEYTDFVVDKVDTEEYRLLPFRSPAAIELFDYGSDILKRMEKGEQFGVLNQIHSAASGGTKMTEGQFRNFFCLAVAAGNDTTRYSISATIHALANHPELLAFIKDNLGDPKFMQTATDEMIRIASPTTHFRRTATKSFDYSGKHIAEGDKVILWFLSGNRDETVFSDPESIDLSRKPNRYLSFGQGGPHVCLGMWLAKLEVRIVIEELAKRVSQIEQTGRQEYLRSNFILGMKHLPVRFKGN